MRFVKLAGTLHPADDEAMQWLMKSEEGDTVEVSAAAKQRTHTQNNAIWKYCKMLADALNAAGYDMRAFPLKEGLTIPWGKSSVMETFWRRVQREVVGKDSTRDLTTKEVNVIYEALDAAISQRTGVHVEFPSKENLHGH